MNEVNLDDVKVNILIELDEKIYLVAMEKGNYDAVSFLVKRAAESLIETGKTQAELNEFLGYER